MMSTAALSFAFLPMLLMMGGLSAPPAVDPGTAEKAYATIADHLSEGGTYYQIQFSEGVAEQMVTRLISVVGQASSAEGKRIFSAVPPLLERNGFFALKGMGASVKPVKDGLQSSRMFWMVDAAGQKTPLWRGILGEASDPSAMLKYLPEQTELCGVLNADTQALWGIVRDFLLHFGAEGDANELADMLAELKDEDMSPVMLAESLTGRAVLSVQLDPDVKVPLPLGRDMLQVPMPSFVAVLEVRDDQFQTELARLLTAGERFTATKQELAGASVMTYQPTRPMPIPLVISCLRVDDLLVIGSNLGVMGRALTVAREGGGLAARGPFQSVADDRLRKSHGMVYVGEGLARLLNAARSKVLTQPGMRDGPGMLLALLEAFPEKPTGWIALSDETGYMIHGRGNGMMPAMLSSQNASTTMLPMLVGVAAPFYGHGKTVAHGREAAAVQRPCIANLRVIDSAKEMWALDHNADAGVTPAWVDILPYIHGGAKPVCPQGGTYTIKPIGQPPACSHKGHQLP